jgi:hypothetical protein
MEVQDSPHQLFSVLVLFNENYAASTICISYQDPSYSKRTDGEILPTLGIQLNNLLLPKIIS